MTELKKAALPTWWIVEQVRGDGDELITLGGRYRREWCVQAFDRGTAATTALPVELKRYLPQPEQRQKEFDQLLRLRTTHPP